MNRAIFLRKITAGVLAGLLSLGLMYPAAAAEAETSAGETTEGLPTEEALPECWFSSPYSLYFGLLHAHTNISDGTGSVEEAFAHASAVENLDFFAVTDHSNSFDNADFGALTTDGAAISAEWAAGKAAAAAVTTDDFLGIFGYEMTWPEIRQLGHITTFNTPGWLTRDQEGFADDPQALEHYLDALGEVPGSVSQFCHPGKQFGNFSRFRHYSPDHDDRVQLLEVLGDGSIESYIQALDQFWHLAPTASQDSHNGNWGSENGLRTVVLADTLTEDSLFDAIRAHRVYATEDPDLHLYWELDGQAMGGILSRADDPEIFVSLCDPTGTGGCTVEVITEGGAIAAAETAADCDALFLSVPGGYRWYFLKLTQADGDIAVTAPVWVEGFENMGILSFAADTDIPIQGEALTLNVKLYNDEPVDLVLESLEIYAGETLVHQTDAPGTVAAGECLTISAGYVHPEPGYAALRAVVRGSVLGRERCFEADLSLRFRPGGTVSGLLIDGSHGNSGLERLDRVKALAGEAGLTVSVFTGDLPLGGEILLIPPIAEQPDGYFYEDVAVFLESGGSLILLADPESSAYGNALLEALGSTLRLTDVLLPEGRTGICNPGADCWDRLAPEQVFRFGEGWALDPGQGQWLVKNAGQDQVLLAREAMPYGGTVLAAGTPFLLDPLMSEARSKWELPAANETLLRALFGTAEQPLTEICIGEARCLAEGTPCRVRGYVTAGTSNPHTTFPDTIYLQDDTAGIAVTGFSVPDIQVGAPMELMGILRSVNGTPSLEYLDHRLTGERYYHTPPEKAGCAEAMDYELHGGQLVQIEGTVTGLVRTEDKKGITRLTVKDFPGDSAIVEIEEAIRSGSTGKNTLAKDIREDRAVRVIGLVHINDAGETVIRVRDCDEVVYVPPKPDPTNPKTADRRWRLP